MPLKNACFFSYRHRPDKSYGIVIDDLYERLAGEVGYLLPSQGVFRDNRRLKGGDFLDQSLASELCGSACMIMIYIPAYFDERETYCAQEFRAMLALEGKRLQRLNGASGSHGLIIPIVCRGWRYFPKSIKAERVIYNFEPYLMQKDKVSQHKDGKRDIAEIASYVFDRVNEIQAGAADPCQDCPGFTIPRPQDVVAWVRDVQSPQGLLPGRTS